MVAGHVRLTDDDDDDHTANSSGDSRVDDAGNPLADGINGEETEGQRREADGGDWDSDVLRGGEGEGAAVDAKRATRDDDGKKSPHAEGETETRSRRGSNDNLETDEDKQQQERRRQRKESGERNDVGNGEEGKQDDPKISRGGDPYENEERLQESHVSNAEDNEEQREQGQQQQQQLYEMPEEQHGEQLMPREGDPGEGKVPQPGENVPQQVGGGVDGDGGQQLLLNVDRPSSLPTVPGRPPSSKPNYRMPQEISVAVALNNAEV